MLSGEGHNDVIEACVDVALEHFEPDQFNLAPLTAVPLPVDASSSPLRFPSHALVHGGNVFVSDTCNHRVLVLSETGEFIQKFGSGRCGFSDGGASEAEFRSPRGLAVKGSELFVADTVRCKTTFLTRQENHAIRKVDLTTGFVSTIVGDGIQCRDGKGGAIGVNQRISSPWALCCHNNALLIAMAG